MAKCLKFIKTWHSFVFSIDEQPKDFYTKRLKEYLKFVKRKFKN